MYSSISLFFLFIYIYCIPPIYFFSLIANKTEIVKLWKHSMIIYYIKDSFNLLLSILVTFYQEYTVMERIFYELIS